MKLTAMMQEELRRLRDLRLPESMLRAGYEGFPYTMLDMRTVEALRRRGLVEGLIHTDRHGYATPCYRITQDGREALAKNTG